MGRPAQHSRGEITAAAVGIADREGLDAVSMRRVAAELGTGAASLYGTSRPAMTCSTS
ncbi:MAG: TetR family transcriptional regulator [Trebonia sp.]